VIPELINEKSSPSVAASVLAGQASNRCNY
jgi:hypothetical protein